MKAKRIVILSFIFILIISSFALGGCKKNSRGSSLTDGSEVSGLYGKKDKKKDKDDLKDLAEYENLAVITSIDDKNKEISLKFIKNDKTESMTYTNGTSVLSKYGNDILMEQLKPGTIVEAYYKKGSQKLTDIKEYADAWALDNTKSFTLYPTDNSIKIGSTTYSYEDSIVVLSDGKLITPMEIESVDEITVNGIGTKVYSISVDVGHGYVVLENQDYFIGGLIEIGPKIIKEIQSDQTIVVPEGSYDVIATKGEISGKTHIDILRNETVNVDVGALQGQLVEKGGIKFNLTPSNAALYIDGTKTNANNVVSLSFGRHTVIVYCKGYETYSEIINVDGDFQNKNITLTEAKQEETKATEKKATEKSNSGSGGQASTPTTKQITTTATTKANF